MARLDTRNTLTKTYSDEGWCTAKETLDPIPEPFGVCWLVSDASMYSLDPDKRAMSV